MAQRHCAPASVPPEKILLYAVDAIKLYILLYSTAAMDRELLFIKIDR